MATWDEETGRLAVLAVNRAVGGETTLEVDLRAFPGLGVASASVLADDDVSAANTRDHPGRVVP